MVFHETADVAVVIMLTQTCEGGREKCAQYFSLDFEAPTLEFFPEKPRRYSSAVENGGTSEETHAREPSGKITLLESSYDETCRSEVRKFELTIGNESKTVWHYLFAGWSDYSKPEGDDRLALLELTQITANRAGSLDNPRVVHCSAGVGRTGTFITLDHLLRELKTGKLFHPAEETTDTIFDTVNQLREQRMMMVFNETQYQFIYEVIKEQALHLLLGHDIPSKGDPHSPDTRSQKIAKLSSDADYDPTPKEELQPLYTISTPNRSWSGTPEVSDNET